MGFNENIDPAKDLRPVFFGDAEWYKGLDKPRNDELSAWYLTKTPENAWWVQLLNVSFEFATRHGLKQEYQRRFAGILPSELRPDRAQNEGRTVTHPIWQIANELIVGRYLEGVLGWQLQCHSPPGRKQFRGDWQFRSTGGREVFVEVKTMREAERLRGGTGVYSRPDYRPRIRSALTEAYKQLPDDGRATLVVLVGDEVMSISHGIMHGDLFQSLYGQMQITFTVLPEYDPKTVKLGPSFHDMFVQHAKHRRIGWAAGLIIRGLGQPGLRFYGIQNPYAHETVRLPAGELEQVSRFVVDAGGRGQELQGEHPDAAWARMSVFQP